MGDSRDEADSQVPFDYRPLVAVVTIVIFSLAAIALIFTMRAQH
jgi:hypothetical protein